MKSEKSQYTILGILLLFTLSLAAYLYLSGGRTTQTTHREASPRSLKLYWLIPDGLRADPSLFTIFRWADEGLMPNLKKMMQSGSYGYSIPVFPGHTPTNFATLLTGSTPRVHGIADGPMHIEGYPLKMVSKGGVQLGCQKSSAYLVYPGGKWHPVHPSFRSRINPAGTR